MNKSDQMNRFDSIIFSINWCGHLTTLRQYSYKVRQHISEQLAVLKKAAQFQSGTDKYKRKHKYMMECMLSKGQCFSLPN